MSRTTKLSAYLSPRDGSNAEPSANQPAWRTLFNLSEKILRCSSEEKKGCGRFSPGKPRRGAFAAIAVYNRFKKHQRLDKYESSSASLIRLRSRPCMRAHAQGGNTGSGL